jgi:hypothetical protein
VVVGDLKAVEAQVRATARRNAALFGVGDASMYRLGSHPELLGRSVSTFRRSSVAGASVHLDGETLLADVRPGSRFVPSRVVGELHGGAVSSGTELAIVVNGLVAGLTRSYSLDGRQRFAAMVPEDALRSGSNDVHVYAVIRTRGTPTLARLGGTTTTSDYSISDDGRAIVVASGARLRVEPDRLEGEVEYWSERGATTRVGGWAADVRDVALADQILLFSGRKLVFAGGTTIFRWDVARTEGREQMARSGWAAEVPSRDMRFGPLRVFAVHGDSASELRWADSAKAAVVASGRP